MSEHRAKLMKPLRAILGDLVTAESLIGTLARNPSLVGELKAAHAAFAKWREQQTAKEQRQAAAQAVRQARSARIAAGIEKICQEKATQKA